MQTNVQNRIDPKEANRKAAIILEAIRTRTLCFSDADKLGLSGIAFDVEGHTAQLRAPQQPSCFILNSMCLIILYNLYKEIKRGCSNGPAYRTALQCFSRHRATVVPPKGTNDAAAFVSSLLDLGNV